MNYLSMISDSTLKIISKYINDNYIFIIFSYCSAQSSEHILYWNVVMRGDRKTLHISFLSLYESIIYLKSTNNYNETTIFKLFCNNIKISSMYYRTCNLCKRSKFNLWKYERGVVMQCDCKN